ncbi:MAG: DUF368 domain-containing protein [Roseburia sp.]|nr:DUF368 domain-containing protein [Anaeroplasma bactoclasticum]MCM1196335.1 DUF368 domain-containing protein [Roseburia sp.]MCM1557554.1 DUF368 domain-containing protein [Anaeroplasma bactoclasticum]
MKYLKIMAKGAIIGLGMIIPGVSGGTLAVLLGIYEELITNISNLRKEFKTSIKFLLPLLLGMILAFGVMYFPLKLALKHIPFELCMIFVALMVCSVPKIGKNAYNSGFHKWDIVFSILAFGLCFGLSFIPLGEELELNLHMPWYMYPSLFLVGILASIALVVPGISGSMLLLIIGLYEPLLNTISNLLKTPLDAFVILLIFAVGLILGFFTIAKLMKHLLSRFEHQTKWAIFGFVIASIIALFLAFDFKGLLTPLHIGIGCACFVLILVGFILLVYFLKKKSKVQVLEEPVLESIE